MSPIETWAALGVAAALAAAGGAYRAAHNTRRAAEGQLLSRLLDDYSSEDMQKAFEQLRRCRDMYKAEFVGVFLKHLQRGEGWALSVDLARRKVARFFGNVLRLYDAGFLSPKAISVIGKLDGREILFDIVEPLELGKNPYDADSDDRRRFDERLRKLFGSDRNPKLAMIKSRFLGFR